jgi:hypothetical protein
MSFYVAALDSNDFDDMWAKINKLVTLVYPQYTKGRLLDDGDANKFVQPFSQLIGASPLIRIRLGDLFRSNYSRFALARLFGAADNDMKLNEEIKFEGAGDVITQINTETQKALKSGDNSVKYTISLAGWPASQASSLGVGISLPIISGPSTPAQAPSLNIDGDDLSYFYLSEPKNVTDTDAVFTVKLYTSAELIAKGANVNNETIENLKKKYNSNDNILQKVIDQQYNCTYKVPLSMLRLSAESYDKIVKDKSSKLATPVNSIENLSKFLDVENNAIVKSFRSVQGKGLAGVIESMSFDWYDKITWETSKSGFKAPKMCKVTLTFSPIHDISPGIDHLGYNRAPIYPVGSAMGQGFDPDKTINPPAGSTLTKASGG